jgi:hypothetical protein
MGFAFSEKIMALLSMLTEVILEIALEPGACYAL